MYRNVGFPGQSHQTSIAVFRLPARDVGNGWKTGKTGRRGIVRGGDIGPDSRGFCRMASPLRWVRRWSQRNVTSCCFLPEDVGFEVDNGTGREVPFGWHLASSRTTFCRPVKEGWTWVQAAAGGCSSRKARFPSHSQRSSSLLRRRTLRTARRQGFEPTPGGRYIVAQRRKPLGRYGF